MANRISNDQLDMILEKHKLWLNGEKEGEKADLSGINLSYNELPQVNLQWANLSNTDLSYASVVKGNFSHANMIGAICCHTNFFMADLRYANLSCADLSKAKLESTDLLGAILNGTDLRVAYLDGSCFPFTYGIADVIVDEKTARLIAAYFCSLRCDSREFRKARADILEFAKRSDKAKSLGLIDYY